MGPVCIKRNLYMYGKRPVCMKRELQPCAKRFVGFIGCRCRSLDLSGWRPRFTDYWNRSKRALSLELAVHIILKGVAGVEVPPPGSVWGGKRAADCGLVVWFGYTFQHTHTHTHTRIRTHTHMLTYTQTHTHTHTHTQSLWRLPMSSS